MPVSWDAALGGRAAIWRRPGKPDQPVRFLDRITVKPGLPPGATVVNLASRTVEAAALDELFCADDPTKPYEAAMRFGR